MQDYTQIDRQGIRTTEQFVLATKPGESSPSWQKTTTTVTGIQTQSRTLVTTNGTGGTPGRKRPTSYAFTHTVQAFHPGNAINGDLDKEYTVTAGASLGTNFDPSIGAPTFSDLSTLCSNDALEKLSEAARGSLDLSIDMFQAGKTKKMVVDVFRLYRYVRSFHPRNWASKWLEYQYGWKPLVNSIYDLAHEACTPRNDNSFIRIKVQRGRSEFKSRETNSSGIIDRCESNFETRVEYMVALNFKQNTVQDLARITSLNPASIAWELVPYSFVVDWVYNIGGYLRCLETAFLMDQSFIYGYKTTGTKETRDYTRKGTQVTGLTSATTVNGSRFYKRTTKNRSALTGYPRPYVPMLKVDMGAARVLSAAALMDQHIPKGIRF